jgi:uncharacterized protein
VAEVKEGRMNPRLPLDETTLARFCERHRIRRLALFGSQLKGTARPDSDIDLLVEFEPSRVPSLLALASMELELAELLGGRRVDLRTAEDLSRYFRDEVGVRQRYSMHAEDRVCLRHMIEAAEIVWQPVTQEIPALLPQLRALATDE